jgi:hypothetical protein
MLGVPYFFYSGAPTRGKDITGLMANGLTGD